MRLVVYLHLFAMIFLAFIHPSSLGFLNESESTTFLHPQKTPPHFFHSQRILRPKDVAGKLTSRPVAANGGLFELKEVEPMETLEIHRYTTPMPLTPPEIRPYEGITNRHHHPQNI